MSNSNLSARSVVVLLAAFGLAVVGCETLLNRTSDATLLLTLTFWTMFAQGAVALCAIGELSKGLWLKPVKRDLYSFYPMIFLMAFLFLLMGMRMSIYGWSTTHPIGWLDTRFFLIRNFVVLLVTGWVARQLAMASMKDDPKKNTYAVYYVLLWVVSQSLIAYDWIMTLEYPFINTLFGPHFFVQSLIMGLLINVFVIFFRSLRRETGLTETLRDTGKMLFGFSFMWGGFVFTQYLVIWYGNVPEEVAFVLKRVDPSPYWGLSRVALGAVFGIPFLALLSRKLKTIPIGMVLVACSSWIGIFVEKVILITPVVPVNYLVVAIEYALMLALAVLVYRARNSFMPQYVLDPSGAGGGGADDRPGDLAAAHRH
jgi:hypothetical protein